jgi:DNA-binding NarL/FixJ family response regulator
MLAEDPEFLQDLESIAQGITSNFHLREVLVHVASIHVSQLELSEPNQKRTYYVKGCKNHMLNWLAQGTSVDSLKRRHNGRDAWDMEQCSSWMPEGLVAKEDVLAAVCAKDLIAVVSKRLTPRDRLILEALAKGYGEGEIAEQMGISRQAVFKRRQKIAAQIQLAE